MGVTGTLVQITESRLEELLESPQVFHQILFRDKGSEADIDATWATIDWLLMQLTRVKNIPHCDPVPGIVSETRSIQIDDTLLQYRRPDEVQAIADVLRTISRDDVVSVFDPETMTEEYVYPKAPDGWSWDDFEYVYSNFEVLVQFYCQAAEKRNAVIMWVV